MLSKLPVKRKEDSHMILLETNRLLLRTIDIPLLNAASKRNHQAIQDLGYQTNGEWPDPAFFEAIPYFLKKLVKTTEQKVLIHGLSQKSTIMKLLEEPDF